MVTDHKGTVSVVINYNRVFLVVITVGDCNCQTVKTYNAYTIKQSNNGTVNVLLKVHYVTFLIKMYKIYIMSKYIMNPSFKYLSYSESLLSAYNMCSFSHFFKRSIK